MGIFGKDRDLTQAPREFELRVDASYFQAPVDGFEMRLDAFLTAHLAWRSRTSIQELIKEGAVLVDPSTPDHPRGSGTALVDKKPGRKLRQGSRVVVIVPEEVRHQMSAPTSSDVLVLYEDEAVIAVDKPANMPVHPSGRYFTDTLIQRVHARFGAGFELERGGAPRLCHRLDKETSGVVLIGRYPTAHANVQAQFEKRAIEKEYLTIVHGVPERDAGVVDYPIGPARASRIELKMAIQVDGQPCTTAWRVVERFADCALVACEPITGRQHQIRVHMAALGYPVVGDKLYGHDDGLFERALEGQLTREDERMLGLARHALHNHKVVFRSPATNTIVDVRSPLPRDMAAYLDARR